MNARQRHRADEARYAAPWAGGYRRYDLVKEFVVALGVMLLLSIGLATAFSSPDRKAISLREWATAAPNDFVVTAVAELDGTSGTATYGAPYTDDPSAGQKLLSVPLQRAGGVREPIDTAHDFVLGPLATVTGDADLTASLETYNKAGHDQQQAWATNYGDALDKAPDNDPAKVATGDYGPVPLLAAKLLDLARSGGLDGQLLSA